MTEQWTGDWMRDAETGQLIDGPTMTRREMFLLVRELRAVIRAHAQTIRNKQAVIDALGAELANMRTYSHETVRGLVDWRDERIRELEGVLRCVELVGRQAARDAQ